MALIQIKIQETENTFSFLRGRLGHSEFEDYCLQHILNRSRRPEIASEVWQISRSDIHLVGLQIRLSKYPDASWELGWVLKPGFGFYPQDRSRVTWWGTVTDFFDIEETLLN